MFVAAGDSLSRTLLVCADRPRLAAEDEAWPPAPEGPGLAAEDEAWIPAPEGPGSVAGGEAPGLSAALRVAPEGRGCDARNAVHGHFGCASRPVKNPPWRIENRSHANDRLETGPTNDRDGGRAVRLAAAAEQVRAIQARHRPEGGRHATGLAALDALLGGGFAEAAVHELVAGKEAAAVDAVAWRAASAAVGGLPLHTLSFSAPRSSAEAARRWLIYIDSNAALFPPALAEIGVPLERLLVVRVSRTTDVLWTFEQCLRCRAVAAVIATLRELDPYVSRRLQLAAEQGGSVGFVLRPDVHVGHTFAATRLRFDPIESETSVRRLRVTPLKLRDGGVREPVIVELCDAAHAVSMDAVPVDRASVARFNAGDAMRRRATG